MNVVFNEEAYYMYLLYILLYIFVNNIINFKTFLIFKIVARILHY